MSLQRHLYVVVHKAQPTVGPVPDVTISFQTELPETETLAQAGEFYETEAERIEDALAMVLPGGTYDALLRKMLLGRASLLRIPFKHDASAVPTGEAA